MTETTAIHVTPILAKTVEHATPHLDIHTIQQHMLYAAALPLITSESFARYVSIVAFVLCNIFETPGGVFGFIWGDTVTIFHLVVVVLKWKDNC